MAHTSIGGGFVGLDYDVSLGDAMDLGGVLEKHSLESLIGFSELGTDADFWSGAGTILDGNSLELDLMDLDIVSLAAATIRNIDFSTVYWVVVRNSGPGTLVVGGGTGGAGAADAWAGADTPFAADATQTQVVADAATIFSSGGTVAAGKNILHLEASGDDVEYFVVVVGVTT